ncbi:hypothetical protein GZ77_00210 [Endozoicomonas montiporae]|uniref:TsaA-like domain-containing protein n=2 Tax=Endozoicomonas montiporae TaxID=1027273 RepID=A0A081N9P0_9GAMM|nr:TrmO family methyltransferase [Endozoicomonas montiporae]AMO55016.1 hypothetical protein EZMO1_0791 [Endozoicomonas montiporae CL-33]KEQ15163.1 hypothetical protein GZ77_00210 [Endozoicomonas montiporae]
MNIVSIGTITAPYNTLAECPNNVDNLSGPLCIEEKYKAGITGLKAGKSIDILYWFHETDKETLLQKSHFRNEDKALMGAFSLRSPNRPNPIALAKLTIVDIEEGKIVVRELDCLNGTSIIDIKPSIS